MADPWAGHVEPPEVCECRGCVKAVRDALDEAVRTGLVEEVIGPDGVQRWRAKQ